MKLFTLLLLQLVLVVALAACGTGGVKEQKQIATSCASITAAGNAIAAAAGIEGSGISKADARKALTIARPTKSFCEPKPADHLNPADYAALLSAAADLATLKEKVK